MTVITNIFFFVACIQAENGFLGRASKNISPRSITPEILVARMLNARIFNGNDQSSQSHNGRSNVENIPSIITDHMVS